MGFPLDDVGSAAFVDSVIDTMLAGLTTR
jgi:hypothetical protein